MHPIFVIDTSVISHHIINRLDECMTFNASRDFEIANKYTKLVYHWMQNLGFLSDVPPKASVIWVKDSKPYWRSQFYPEYKHGRKPHSQQFSYAYDILQGLAKPLGFNGYEADDVAALLYYVRNRRKNAGHMYLVTIDCDWCGFVDENTTWLNTAHYYPRIRNTPEVKAWMQNKLKREPKVKYTLREDFKASDIWAYKVAAGDKSDNLPIGAPSYLIDLMNPHPAYKLWDKSEAIRAAAQRLDTFITPRQDIALLETMMSRMGMVTPIQPFLPDVAAVA